jgi:NAD(P)H-hydrate epimerase
LLASPAGELKGPARRQYRTAVSMGLKVMEPDKKYSWAGCLEDCDLVIDGLIGYSLKGNPRGNYSYIIKLANKSGKKILAIDCPSGLDSDTGEVKNPCIRAQETVALTLPKRGLFLQGAREVTGDVYVADMGIPHGVYDILGIDVPRIFEREDIVKAVAGKTAEKDS